MYQRKYDEIFASGCYKRREEKYQQKYLEKYAKQCSL